MTRRHPDRPPPDQAARERIVTDLDHTLFVEAGAGSGKTTALVDRIVALVSSGAEDLAAIAAITFTEKAAAELRHRVRARLQDAVERAGEVTAPTFDDALVAERCRRALDQLDGAAIGTLHAFARRILTHYPLEAGLPPRVEVLDELSSELAFERRWRVDREHLFGDRAVESALDLLVSIGVRLDTLRELAVAMHADWDLVAERVPATAGELPDPRTVIDRALARLRAVADRRAECVEPDAFAGYLDELAGWLDGVEACADTEFVATTIGPRAQLPSTRARGTAKAWPDVESLRAAHTDARQSLDAARVELTSAATAIVGSALRRYTLVAAAERRAAGELEFVDLLVLARNLLTDPVAGPAVRRDLHDRYRRLLLDEFQDTDPIQIELAVRIAAVDPGGPDAGVAPWHQVTTRPGHLFVVGDPKQSIYRFRRADIATFLAAQARFGPSDDAGLVRLTANFRSAVSIIDAVNALFDALLSTPPEVETPAPSQPGFVALSPMRPDPAVGPAVSVIGWREHGGKPAADDLRRAESADVAAAIDTAIADGWTVSSDRGPRPARLADISVLVPSRTVLPFLEDALDEASIPYRVESSSLVYSSRAVRDLLAVVRAVADPTDELALFSALRTPLFGCGDDDLFRFRVEANGRWDYLAHPPPALAPDDPVAAGMRWLRETHERRHWFTPAQLLDLVARDRRAFELALVGGRARDLWRRMRWLIDQARAFTEAHGGGLREFIDWVDRQAGDRSRVAEAVLPEVDDDAVRIMTIHAAKGLEFPVVIVAGMTGRRGSATRLADVVFPPDAPPAYRLAGAGRTLGFDDWAAAASQYDADERVRLLYVACTRAVDHLVISLHRSDRPSAKVNSQTDAARLAVGLGDRLGSLPDVGVGSGAPSGAAVTRLTSGPRPAVESLEDWRRTHDRVIERAGRPSTIAATALSDEGAPDADDPTAGLMKGPRDHDLPPWLKGRYGTAVGRAVHGVLQTIDLAGDGAAGEALAAAVAAQCEAEAVADRAADVGRLVRYALAAPTVVAAAGSQTWRELYVCAPFGAGLLEGYLDLVYRSPTGLVVVDYKTSASSDPAELDRRVDLYRDQGTAYALALAHTAGEPVARVVFVFLTPSEAVERELVDLDRAVGELGDRLRGGTGSFGG